MHFVSASRRSDFEGEFGAFVSALQATPRFDDNPCACRRCTLGPISGRAIDNDDLCDALTEAPTAPIASSSPRQGMTAETMSVTPGMIALIRQDTKPASQTPAQPAIGAGRGRPIRQERGAKRVVRRPVPDVLQALLGRVP